MKKDLTIALAAVVVAAGICYGLAAIRPNYKLRPSQPYSLDLSPTHAATGKVVMRINDTPVSETEFNEAFRQLPEEMQRQFASPEGKQAFAEQYVRLKLLAAEGEKMGVVNDPHVAAQLNSDHTNIVAGATLQKLVKVPDEGAVRSFYNAHRQQYETVELSHIVIAYQGGMIPPREGGTPPPEQAAAQKAMAIYQKVRQGADFGQMARDYSDDPASAQNGGVLGPFSKGMLPPEIESQVVRLQPGQVSGPIPSRYGIHLFKLGLRTTQPLEKVKPMVERQLQQQNAFDRVELLRKNAKVDFDPKFFPDAKSWGKNGPGRQAPPS